MNTSFPYPSAPMLNARRVLLAASFLIVATAAAPTHAASVSGSINWASPTGRTATGLHFGLNVVKGYNPAIAGTPGNATYKSNVAYIGPGLIRYHRSVQMQSSSSNVDGWVISPTTSSYGWDETKINNALTGSYQTPAGIMNIVNWPAYLDDGNGRLQPSRYAEYAAFCARLVEIVNKNPLYPGRYIKYWEVLNEKGGSYWHTNPSSTNGTELGRIYNLCAASMRAVDATIKVGGPADADPEGSYINNITQFISVAAPSLDFVTYHKYPSNSVADSDATIYNLAAGLGSYVTTVRSIISNYTSRELEIFVDEFNVNYRYKSPNIDSRMGTIKGGIFDALAIISNINAGATGTTAFCEADDVHGKLDNAFALRSGAHVLMLFNKFNMMGTVVASSTSNSGSVVIFATKGTSSRKFVLVNRSGASQTIRLSFNGWSVPKSSSSTFTVQRVSSSGNANSSVTYSTLTSSTGYSLPANTVTFLYINDI